MSEPIDVPLAALEQITEAHQQAQVAQQMLQARMESVRAALDVPDGYTLNVSEQAFVKADGDD